MEKAALQEALAILLPGSVADPTGEWLQLQVAPEAWQHASIVLRNDPSLLFDFLFCVTCIDWKTQLTMVYHFRSTVSGHTLVVKINLPRDRPQLYSVAGIWRTAEFNEREAFEMFGVDFLQHPDLRLLILPDGWEGRFPMRKDFEDPVNMIKL
jgi:NADH-quinone oxidoreductase subunit C